MGDAAETPGLQAARIVGPILLILGGIFFIGGIVSFQRAASSFGNGPFGESSEPNMVLPFLGVLCIGIGGFVTKWAYVGPASRYVARETAPAVGITTRAVMAEVRAEAGRACPGCHSQNAKDATFCKACGTALARACGRCGGSSPADARFCDDCGRPMA